MRTLIRITIIALVGFSVCEASNSQARDHQGLVSTIYRFNPLDTGLGSVDSMREFELTVSQNYPNPFRLGTTIDYVLPRQSFVEITIYDARGVRIRTLVSELQNAGTHRVM